MTLDQMLKSKYQMFEILHEIKRLIVVRVVCEEKRRGVGAKSRAAKRLGIHRNGITRMLAIEPLPEPFPTLTQMLVERDPPIVETKKRRGECARIAGQP